MMYQKFDEGNDNILDIKLGEIKKLDKPKKA